MGEILSTRDLPSSARMHDSIGGLPGNIVDRIEIGHPAGCWWWKGAPNAKGYGVACIGQLRILAHRLVWMTLVGDIPSGMTVDHLCVNPACVNPAHMEIVDRVENWRRGAGPTWVANKTHCPQGHPYDETNTHWYRGWRYCRACKRKVEARA